MGATVLNLVMFQLLQTRALKGNFNGFIINYFHWFCVDQCSSRLWRGKKTVLQSSCNSSQFEGLSEILLK